MTGTTRLGTRFVHRRRLLGVRVERAVTITDWQPPFRFVASFEVAGTRIDSIHLAQPCATGCLYTLALSGRPRGLFKLARLVLWLVMLPAVRRGVMREVDDMRSHFGRLSSPAPIAAAPIVPSAELAVDSRRQPLHRAANPL